MDSSKIKKGLGRGLSSLIGETKIETNINKLLISDLKRGNASSIFDLLTLSGPLPPLYKFSPPDQVSNFLK